MKIAAIISFLESIAPPVLQESYDNAGLLTGDADWECSGIICTLDATEEVIREAIEKNCNLVVAHHPIIFSGLKKINGKNYVEKTIIHAIKNDIAIYAIHTNLDHMLDGVNGKMADQLGLINRQILAPKTGLLRKLHTFVPVAQADTVREALFAAGAGHIGNYSECSFNTEGMGTYKAGLAATPVLGEIGKRHAEPEVRMELIFPAWLERPILAALKKAHPYEEVAYDCVPLANQLAQVGSGLLGELPEPVEEQAFLGQLKATFGLSVVRHTALLGHPVKQVAICGGAGSFLISNALAAGTDFYITADIKYHEFFDANGRMVLADIGHYESEQFTTSLLYDILSEKFTTFAVLKSGIKTNPVFYA